MLNKKEIIESHSPTETLSEPLADKSIDTDSTIHSTIREMVKDYISSVSFLDENQQEVKELKEMKRYYLRIECQNLKDYKDPHVGFRIQNYLGAVVYETNTYCQQFFPIQSIKNGRISILFHIPQLSIIQGEYSLSIGVVDQGYGRESFKTVLSPTALYLSFFVKRDQEDTSWAGISNLNIGVSSE